MRFNKPLLISIICICVVNYTLLTYADDDEADKQEAKDARLLQGLSSPPEITIKGIVEVKRPRPPLPAEKTALHRIDVTGATVLSQKEINNILSPYADKDLTGQEMQKIADLITDAYARKGYITSFAYVVPDKISQGVLQIQAHEGTTGDVKVEGNRYFRSSLIKKKITSKKGVPFNIDAVQNDVYRINRNPDRRVSLTLEPGAEQSVADIILTVKDHYPFHYNYNFDNYGSRYIKYKRHKSFFTHNNLTGHDDVLVTKWEFAEYSTHKILDFDYFLPIADKTKLELYYMPYKREDYKLELQYIGREKKAQDFKVIIIESLYDRPNGTIDGSLGFGYWDIRWYDGGYKEGTKIGADRIRAVLLSLELDLTDRFGRTIMTNDVHCGIPGILNGLGSKDDRALIPGAGSEFVYEHLTLSRKHGLIFDTDLIFKMQYQYSTHTLIGPRKFTVGGTGGVVDMRGYSRADALGDSGVSASTGIDFPLWFLPRNIKVPFSKAAWYNALRLFVIRDWATAHLKSVPSGTKPNETLSSAGCGLTFRLPEHSLSFRVDVFWPTARKPADGHNCHTWVSFSKDYTF